MSLERQTGMMKMKEGNNERQKVEKGVERREIKDTMRETEREETKIRKRGG